MENLLHNEEQTVQGSFTAKMIISAGSASLEIQLDEEGFHPITDDEGNSVFTETTTLNISDLGFCKIRAVLTGDAVVLITQAVMFTKR